MPKPATPKRPRARSGPNGTAPGVMIDDLAAERNSPPLPPEPVFTIDLVEAEGGKRGRRYVAELEEHSSRNARAAAEARRIALEQRRHLEEASRGRLQAEREISKLQRELQTAVAEQERLAALNKQPRVAEAPEPAPVEPPRGGAARSELTRTREVVEQQQRLLGDRREQLVHAIRERDEARLETRRLTDARDRAERRLSRATEILQHNALEATGQSASAAVSERELLAEEYHAAHATLELRVEHLTEELERLTAHTVEVEAALEHALATTSDLTEQLAGVHAIVAERDTATARAATLERHLAATADERETAVSQLADLQRVATAREADETLSALQVIDLTERLADLEATAAATTAHSDDLEQQLAATMTERADTAARIQELEAWLTATSEERETAVARIAELEATPAAPADDASNDETLNYVDELEARLARAELHAAAAATRIIELEEMALTAPPTPDPTITRSLALEELGQLAAPDPAPERPIELSERAEPVIPVAFEPEPGAAEPGDLRRSLLADLSDLAHGPEPGTDL